MVNPIAAVGSTVAALVVAGGTGVVIWYFFFRKKPKFTFTDPAVKVPLRIVDRQPASHDTIRLKLALPSTEHRPGIPVGKHVYFVARIEGQTVVRPYTPVSLDTQKGYMDFVIKIIRDSATSMVRKLYLPEQPLRVQARRTKRTEFNTCVKSPWFTT
ncbi:hypothetical protein CRM22_001111 [Opisthorchis felineus]|uniref:FAD-binding FR-type domain-containing protein n=1 Tax=Opisthorchis felineus TaxID=147828 RepID=A0A4S2MC01_OPIFE|nr:hypothetical protein CRM22_001111 [Opisthorchis felineus]